MIFLKWNVNFYGGSTWKTISLDQCIGNTIVKEIQILLSLTFFQDNKTNVFLETMVFKIPIELSANKFGVADSMEGLEVGEQKLNESLFCLILYSLLMLQ